MGKWEMEGSVCVNHKAQHKSQVNLLPKYMYVTSSCTSCTLQPVHSGTHLHVDSRGSLQYDATLHLPTLYIPLSIHSPALSPFYNPLCKHMFGLASSLGKGNDYRNCKPVLWTHFMFGGVYVQYKQCGQPDYVPVQRYNSPRVTSYILCNNSSLCRYFTDIHIRIVLCASPSLRMRVRENTRD